MGLLSPLSLNCWRQGVYRIQESSYSSTTDPKYPPTECTQLTIGNTIPIIRLLLCYWYCSMLVSMDKYLKHYGCLYEVEGRISPQVQQNLGKISKLRNLWPGFVNKPYFLFFGKMHVLYNFVLPLRTVWLLDLVVQPL